MMNLKPVRPWKPTKADLAAARDKTVADVIAPGLKVVFCGINPGLYTAAIGHHFGRPGNRFWPALHAGGFTDRVLSPFDEQELLRLGLGIINMVDRATATAAELQAEELIAGARVVEQKAHRYRPDLVAFLGVASYRVAFARPKAGVGPQKELLGPARIWILPNPSGLNAHYQLPDLARLFGALRKAAEKGV
jgi:TDG/mug DNA glycosylase family protein